MMKHCWRDGRIEFDSGSRVYRQTVSCISSAVSGGLLKSGDRLPTVRELHGQLEANLNTVAKAYGELELRDLITGGRGKGPYVWEGAAAALPGQEQHRAAVDSLCLRFPGEAAGCGVTEKVMK